MIFLIEYDRGNGVVTDMKTFPESERTIAEDARLTLELLLNQSGISKEIVLLEAPTEEALRHTHRRYFENLAQLARSSAATATTG